MRDSRAAGGGAPLAVWLISYCAALLMPPLWLITENWPHAFNLRLFLLMLVWTVVPSLVVLYGLHRWSDRGVKWSLGVATVVTLVLFQWPTFTRTSDVITTEIGGTFLGDVIPVALAGGLIWLAVRLADELLFAAIIAVGVIAATGAMALTSFPLLTSASAPAHGAAAPSSPDVVLILLDGHARADWYTENDLDGGDLPGSLAQRGFDVAARATANYSYTLGAFGSMMNLDYVFDLGEIDEDERQLMRHALVGGVGLIPMFREAGYETLYTENGWGGSLCGPGIDRCVGDGSVARSLWAIGQMTILSPILETVTTNPFNAQSVDQLLEFDDVVLEAMESPRPTLAIGHFIVPHPPNVLSADCSRLALGPYSKWGNAPSLRRPRLEAYAAQSRCVETVVTQLVDDIVAAAPDTVIMVVSDHGPGPDLDPQAPIENVDPAVVKDRMRILNAVYLPGCGQDVPDNLSPVNGIRLVTNCALGTDLAMLPETTYWIPADARGPAFDVAPLVDG